MIAEIVGTVATVVAGIADATGIVVITQLRPISVFFNLPQQRLPDLNRGMAEGELPIEALTPEEAGGGAR